MTSLNKHIKTKILFYLIFSMIIFSGCEIFKKNTNKNQNRKKNKIENIINNNKKNTLKFNTFSATFSGKYTENNKKFPLKGIIKIKTNKFVWITLRPFLGIEVAKIMFTPDSVKYIDKINKKYFVSSYEYTKQKFGTEINYKSIENIFTNTPVTFPVNKNILEYNLEKNENLFILSNSGKYTNKITFDENNLLIKETYKDSSANIKLEYSEFKKINQKFFPEKTVISATVKNKKSNAEITFKNIKTNTNLNIKFKIPADFKKMKL